MKFLLVLLCLTALVFGDEAVKDPVNEEIHQTQEAPSKTIFSFAHLPSFPQFHLPSIPQFHLPSFPQFPTLPKLPSFTHHIPAPFKRETITATKTVFVELTKKVTRHPICVTAYGLTPPCLAEYHRDTFDEIDEELEQQKAQIIPTAVASLPEPATRILGQITESEVTIEDNEDQHIQGESRQGRYIVRHPVSIFPTRGEIRTEPNTPEKQKEGKQDEEIINDMDKVERGIFKATHHITKTLWVTKVEKVINHGVTATLVAKNCFPVDPRIPLCGPIQTTHYSGGGHVGGIDIGGESHGNGFYGGLFGNSLHKTPSHATPIIHNVKQDENKEESDAVEIQAAE